MLIPTYNNDHALGDVIDGVLQYTDQIIVVNDGSTDGTATILANYPQIKVHTFPQNQGKGKGLRVGFQLAVEAGYRYAITIDSDGQHKPKDLPVFMEAIQQQPNSLIVGARNMEQSSVPGTSSFGHKFSNFWYWVETGIKLEDTQSGYRLYPVELLKNFTWLTPKYEFEIEVLVRAAWGGIDVFSVPVEVYYAPPETRVSHFRKGADFTRISILNTVLVILALLYGRPKMLYWSIKKKRFRKFVRENLFDSNESAGKLAGAVALGIFWGIMPIWGYQWAAALVMAQLLKLNKLITYTFTNISIPPMIPLILFASLQLGMLIIPDSRFHISYSSGINFNEVKIHLTQYLAGSLVLACLAAICAGLLTFVLIRIFRNNRAQAQNQL